MGVRHVTSETPAPRGEAAACVSKQATRRPQRELHHVLHHICRNTERLFLAVFLLGKECTGPVPPYTVCVYTPNPWPVILFPQPSLAVTVLRTFLSPPPLATNYLPRYVMTICYESHTKIIFISLNCFQQDYNLGAWACREQGAMSYCRQTVRFLSGYYF